MSYRAFASAVAVAMGLSTAGWSTSAGAVAKVQLSHIFTVVDQSQAGRAELTFNEPNGNAFGYADNATGLLGARVSNHLYNGVSMEASVGDSHVVFDIAGATADTLTPIQFLIGLDGDAGNATFLSSFRVEREYPYALSRGLDAFPIALNATESGFVTTDPDCAVSGTSSNYTAVCTVLLKGQQDILGVGQFLRVRAGMDQHADFSHTASLRIRAPESVRFTSSSGTFLTSVGGVPEPAAWSLMIGGFALCGAVLRRRAHIAGS